jgi:ABC-type phosphate/phosphonate transport system permease subunit
MKINFSINGVKRYIEPDYVWWAAHWKKVAIVAAVVIFAFSLSGCATGGNQAYTAAHEAASKRGIAEAQARAKSDETLALAVASAAKSCESDVCRMGAMLTFANMKAAAGSAIQSAAPAIAAPVNEVLEWAKVLVPAATGAYTAYLGTALGIVNSTKGAADKDVAGNALISITPVAPWATPIQ